MNTAADGTKDYLVQVVIRGLWINISLVLKVVLEMVSKDVIAGRGLFSPDRVTDLLSIAEAPIQEQSRLYELRVQQLKACIHMIYTEGLLVKESGFQTVRAHIYIKALLILTHTTPASRLEQL